MRKLAPLFATLLLLITASLATAQESAALPMNIKEGSVVFDHLGPDTTGLFTFAGTGLTLTGGVRDGIFSPDCAPCIGGGQVHIRATYQGELSFSNGTLSFGSQTLDNIFYAGSLTFEGGFITLPIRYSRLPFKITVPITLNGNLYLYRTSPFISNAGYLFTVPVNLQGTATLTFAFSAFNLNGRPMYRLKNAAYDFPQGAKAQMN